MNGKFNSMATIKILKSNEFFSDNEQLLKLNNDKGETSKNYDLF